MTDTNLNDSRTRCPWAASVPDFLPYHDTEWGVPVADDTKLFEKMSLESFQSGLSWRLILAKRDNFRRAFAGFRPEAVAAFDETDVARLLGDAGIVRHRGKIEAVVNNARVALQIADEHGSLAAFVWSFEPPPEARPERLTLEVARTLTQSPESVALAKGLKRLGWRFFGPTTAYAFMQSEGIVNDHLETCFCRPRVEAARADFERPKPRA